MANTITIIKKLKLSVVHGYFSNEVHINMLDGADLEAVLVQVLFD